MMVKMYLTTCFSLLLPFGICHADQNDTRLDGLFSLMAQTDSPHVANQTASKIWEIWLQNDDKQTQDRLAAGIAAMDHDPRKALQIFNALINDDPEFAEGWNKRATLLYILGDFAASKRDIERTLALEPRHFGALSGLGLIHLAQNNFFKARAAFEAALLINPNSRSIRGNIEPVDNYLRRNSV